MYVLLEYFTKLLVVIQANQMLKVVSLSSNGFSNDGVAALADALKINSSLIELDITYVQIKPLVNTIKLVVTAITTTWLFVHFTVIIVSTLMEPIH